MDINEGIKFNKRQPVGTVLILIFMDLWKSKRQQEYCNSLLGEGNINTKQEGIGKSSFLICFHYGKLSF